MKERLKREPEVLTVGGSWPDEVKGQCGHVTALEGTDNDRHNESRATDDRLVD